jgi:hypothetical protein
VRGRPEATQRRHRRAQVVPRHRLGLAQEWRDIGETRPHALASQRVALEFLDAGHGLAGAAVSHDAGETLGAVVEGVELVAGLVVEGKREVLSFHRSVTALA